MSRRRVHKPQRVALIVATSTYKDSRFQTLRAAGHDAPALAKVLRDPHIGEFRVRRVLDRTVHATRKEIEKFFLDRSPDDFLLLHMSCHGIKDDEGRLYFVAANTQHQLLGSTAISADFISDLMERSRARSIVLMLDCCYSGAFAKGSRGDQSINLRERFLKDVPAGRGRVVLTASNAIEYAWEGDVVSGEGQPSVFTRAIVNGLRTGEAARPRRSYISIDDLYDYVSREVRKVGVKQTPQKWAQGVEGELVIAKAVPRTVSRTRSSEQRLILIADDDRAVAQVAETYLLLAGFETAVANDGEDALVKAIDLKPDLVVLDVMMPWMDGYEVCAKLREDNRTKHIPVIFLSAKSLRADKVYGLTIGADDYIVKPFDPDELVARVKAVLRRI
jgi:CheY-like chemotaxis protein